MANALTREDLQHRLEAMRQQAKEKEEAIKQRIARVDARTKAIKDLERWLRDRGLERHDLLIMYNSMAPQRESKAVKSRKPLHPEVKAARTMKVKLVPGKLQSKHIKAPLRGLGSRGGKQHAPKGDPEFRRQMREARIAQELSTAQLAKIIGRSDASVNNWESGRNVPAEDARQTICRTLGLPPDLGQKASLAMQVIRGGKKNGADVEAAP